jgi:hypothetical protein
MKTIMWLADHGLANGQEKRPSCAESLLAAFDGQALRKARLWSEFQLGRFETRLASVLSH